MYRPFCDAIETPGLDVDVQMLCEDAELKHCSVAFRRF